MCTHTIWIHCKVNAYFHPRNVDDLGRIAFFNMVWRPFIPFRVRRNQTEHAFVCQWIYYTCKYHRDWEDAFNRSDYLTSLSWSRAEDCCVNKIIVGEPMLSFSEQDMCFSWDFYGGTSAKWMLCTYNLPHFWKKNS